MCLLYTLSPAVPATDHHWSTVIDPQLTNTILSSLLKRDKLPKHGKKSNLKPEMSYRCHHSYLSWPSYQLQVLSLSQAILVGYSFTCTLHPVSNSWDCQMVVLQDGHKRNHIKNYRNYTHSRHAKVPPAHFAQVVATWRAVIDENATKWSKSKLSSCLTTCKPPTSHCRTIQNTEVRFVGHDLGHIVNLVSSFSIVQRCTFKDCL